MSFILFEIKNGLLIEMDYDPMRDINKVISQRIATSHDEAALFEYNFLQRKLYQIWDWFPPSEVSGKWKEYENFLKRRIEVSRKKLSETRTNV